MQSATLGLSKPTRQDLEHRDLPKLQRDLKAIAAKINKHRPALYREVIKYFKQWERDKVSTPVRKFKAIGKQGDASREDTHSREGVLTQFLKDLQDLGIGFVKNYQISSGREPEFCWFYNMSSIGNCLDKGGNLEVISRHLYRKLPPMDTGVPEVQTSHTGTISAGATPAHIQGSSLTFQSGELVVTVPISYLNERRLNRLQQFLLDMSQLG